MWTAADSGGLFQRCTNLRVACFPFFLLPVLLLAPWTDKEDDNRCYFQPNVLFMRFYSRRIMTRNSAYSETICHVFVRRNKAQTYATLDRRHYSANPKDFLLPQKRIRPIYPYLAFLIPHLLHLYGSQSYPVSDPPVSPMGSQNMTARKAESGVLSSVEFH